MADPYQWASPTTLVDQGYPTDIADRAIFSASWLLWALTGRTLHADGSRIDTWELKPGGRSKVHLQYQPVISIESVESYSPWVTTAASGTPVTDYALFGNVLQVHRVPDIFYPVDANISGPATRWATPTNVGPIDTTGDSYILTVEYTVGSNLPPMTYLTVLRLAEEYCKAAVGKGCNLPERVTSITRSGMTWTMLDPGDFVDRGLTGILGIDGWIAAVNPQHRKQRAKVFDPAAPKLLSSTWERVPTTSIINPDSSTTYYGHGTPAIILLTDAVAGDSYVDLDTGKTYGAV